MLAGQTLQTRIEFVWIVLCELRDCADAEKVEITFDGRADGDEVLEAAWLWHGSTFLISLYFRHKLKQNVPQLRCTVQQVFMDRNRWPTGKSGSGRVSVPPQKAIPTLGLA